MPCRAPHGKNPRRSDPRSWEAARPHSGEAGAPPGNHTAQPRRRRTAGPCDSTDPAAGARRRIGDRDRVRDRVRVRGGVRVGDPHLSSRPSERSERVEGSLPPMNGIQDREAPASFGRSLDSARQSLAPLGMTGEGCAPSVTTAGSGSASANGGRVGVRVRDGVRGRVRDSVTPTGLHPSSLVHPCPPAPLPAILSVTASVSVTVTMTGSLSLSVTVSVSVSVSVSGSVTVTPPRPPGRNTHDGPGSPPGRAGHRMEVGRPVRTAASGAR